MNSTNYLSERTYPAYVYFICNKITGEFYWGFRSQNEHFKRSPEEDFWIHYFTSSKKIKSLIKQHGTDIFEANIIYQSKNLEECFWFEQQKIKESIENPLCLNMNYVDPDHPGRKIFSTAGLKMSLEYCQKLSKNRKGKTYWTGKKRGPMSEETKEKQRLAHLGKQKSEENIEKLRNATIGRDMGYWRGKKRGPMSEEQKMKLRGPRKKSSDD